MVKPLSVSGMAISSSESLTHCTVADPLKAVTHLLCLLEKDNGDFKIRKDREKVMREVMRGHHDRQTDGQRET